MFSAPCLESLCRFPCQRSDLSRANAPFAMAWWRNSVLCMRLMVFVVILRRWERRLVAALASRPTARLLRTTSSLYSPSLAPSEPFLSLFPVFFLLFRSFYRYFAVVSGQGLLRSRPLFFPLFLKLSLPFLPFFWTSCFLIYSFCFHSLYEMREPLNFPFRYLFSSSPFLFF